MKACLFNLQAKRETSCNKFAKFVHMFCDMCEIQTVATTWFNQSGVLASSFVQTWRDINENLHIHEKIVLELLL